MSEILEKLDISGEQPGAGTGSWLSTKGPLLECVSPIDGRAIASIRTADREEYEQVARRAPGGL